MTYIITKPRNAIIAPARRDYAAHTEDMHRTSNSVNVQIQHEHGEMIDVVFLRECFSYCPNTGELRWNQRPAHHFKSEVAQRRWNGRYAGNFAGTEVKHAHRRNYRYLLVGLAEMKMKAHRIILALHHGSWPRDDQQVDHIDGNPLNNRIDNLRLVSNSENGKNKRLQSNSTTGLSGVTWHSRRSRFQVHIGDRGKSVHLGYFDNLLDAAAARKSAEIAYGYHENHGSRRGEYE